MESYHCATLEEVFLELCKRCAYSRHTDQALTAS